MKKLALALVLGFAASACNPSIANTPEPTNQIQAQFNPAASPPVLPVPTDLAVNPANGYLNIPVNTYPNPVDQSFVVYLDSLKGYPTDTPGSATFSGSLNASTLTLGTTVLVIDETGGTFVPVTTVAVSYADTPTSTTSAGTLTIQPPTGGWTAGHTYDFAITDGIAGANGEVVVGTPEWLLARSNSTLVSCPAPFTSKSCASLTSLIPSAADAIALEQVRLEYQPILGYLDKTPATARAHIPLLWRFTASGGVTLDFNSTGPSCPPNVPSPTNLAINPVTGLVSAPVCATYSPAQQEFTTDYLNTQNGFPVIATATAPVINGDLDPTTVNSFSIVTLDVTPVTTPDGGLAPPFAVAPAGYGYVSGQLIVQPPAGGWTKGETYAIGVLSGMSGGVTDTMGNPVVPNDAFALIENANPLALCPDGGSPDPLGAFTCPSTLSVAALSDAQASQAEVVREQLAPILAALQAAGGVASILPTAPNADGGQPVFVGGIAMAWAFTITSQAEIQFNLAQSPTDGGASAAIVPFPNDLLFLGSQGDGGHVCLAATYEGQCLDQSAIPTIQAIDTLDGFSLTAPAIVVNDGTLAALDTLTDGVRILQVGSGADGGAPFNPVASANTVQLVDGGPMIPVAGATPAYTSVSAGLIPLVANGTPALTQVCVNCDSTPNPDGGGFASDSLQILPSVPLIEDTPYAAYVQTSLLGDNNLPVVPSLEFALVRMANPLVDMNGHATVQGLSDPQAAQLEQIRLGYEPLFDALDAAGLPRATLAMAWNYHTQTDMALLYGLYSLANPSSGVAGVVPSSITEYTMPLDAGVEVPQNPDGGTTTFLFPNRPEYVLPIDAAFDLPDGGNADPAPHSHIKHFVAGAYFSANVVTGPSGTVNPDPTQWETTRLPFIMTLPIGTPPAAADGGSLGWPLVIFGHGVTRSRIDMLALADSYAAAGFAVVAEDIIDHGDRSVCAGVTDAGIPVYPDGGLPSSDDDACHSKASNTCDRNPNHVTYGKCIGRNPGSDLPCGNPHSVDTLFPPGASGDLLCTLERQGFCNEAVGGPGQWHCQGGDFLRESNDNVAEQPVISGWNIFSLSNLFQTRDNLRQQMVDLGQMENILLNASTGLNLELAEWGLAPVDSSQINYTGQSLGGILGTMFTSVSNNVQNSVLNVAGGGFVQILKTSPAFGPTYQAFQATYAAATPPVTPGMAAYDTLIHSAEWILDDCDPRVAAEYLAGYQAINTATPMANRNVLGLYIEGDEVVTTPAELAENYCAENSPVATNPFTALEFVPDSTTNPSAGGPAFGLDLGDRHGFLLNFVNPTITEQAQGYASGFVANPVGGPAGCIPGTSSPCPQP